MDLPASAVMKKITVNISDESYRLLLDKQIKLKKAFHSCTLGDAFDILVAGSGSKLDRHESQARKESPVKSSPLKGTVDTDAPGNGASEPPEAEGSPKPLLSMADAQKAADLAAQRAGRKPILKPGQK